MRNRIFLISLVVTIMASAASAKTISLDGEWQFAVDSSGVFDIQDVVARAKWRTAQVPLSWQAQFNDLRDYQGVAWYRKRVILPQLQPDETVLLTFEAVDYLTRVYLNGRLAGEHEGGYTPFTLDIIDFVKPGQNEIIVRVLDPANTAEGTEGISYWHIPHGKQSWYVQTSGLWQSVRLEIRPARHIAAVLVTPDNSGRVQMEVRLRGRPRVMRSEALAVRILDPDGQEVAIVQRKLNPGEELIRLHTQVKNPRLWDLQTPLLYTAEVLLENGDKVLDRFGFRSFETRDGKFYLNSEPLYLIGALDQDFYPQNIYSTPSEDYLRDEMQKAKQLGLNLLRCHIKVPDSRYLKVADEVGLLVWTEVPHWDVFTAEAAKRGENTFHAMLERDWNHPSLVILGLINESWGVDLQQADQRQWLLQVFDRAKQRAVGRLVVDNSACWGNFHLKTDINDYHTYWAIPENRKRFDETVAEVGGRPDWLFSGFGDAQSSGHEPLLMSEFGNWGLPNLPAQLPWWFERDFLGREVTLPAGVHERFSAHGYDEIFDTYNGLADESQRAQTAALKHQIESLRKNASIQGYVITEFTDINWECNGLLDMWRNFKLNANDLRAIQQQDVVIQQPERYTFWVGDSVVVKVWLSHYSSEHLRRARIEWEMNSDIRGQFAVPEMSRAEVREIGSLAFTAPPLGQPQPLQLRLSLKDAQGRKLAENHCEVFVFPRFEDPKSVAQVYDPNNALAPVTGVLGSHDKRDREVAIVTNVLDDHIIEQLQAGAAVVCLVDSHTVAAASFPFELISRDAEWYDGNWASNLNWVRTKRSPFQELSFGPRLGLESAYAAPSRVLTKIPAESFYDVLAGMYVGWLHLNSGYVVQMLAGKGKLLVCTIDLVTNLTSDPYSQTLLRNLVRHVVGDSCKPQLAWPL